MSQDQPLTHEDMPLALLSFRMGLIEASGGLTVDILSPKTGACYYCGGNINGAFVIEYNRPELPHRVRIMFCSEECRAIFDAQGDHRWMETAALYWAIGQLIGRIATLVEGDSHVA